MLYWRCKLDRPQEYESRHIRSLLCDIPTIVTAPVVEPLTVEFRSMLQHKETERVSATRRQQTAQLEALLAANFDLTAELKLDKVFQALVSHAIDLTGSDAGCLYVYHPEQDHLESVLTIGVESLSIHRFAQRSMETAEKAMESQSPLVVEDAQDGNGYNASATIAALPLRQEGRLLGVLEVVARSPGALSGDDMDLLRQLTHQAGIAIQNAQRYEEANLRAEHLAIINRIADTVGKTLDLEGLTKVVYREIEAAFELDAFFLALYDEETQELNYRIQMDGGTMSPPERKPLGTGLTASVIREQEPLLIRDFEEERKHLPPAELWGTMETPSSWLGVPMQVADRTVGVICVQAYRPDAYGEAERDLLTTIAEQVTVGVENARLYEEMSQRLAQSQVLRELMLAASSTLDFDLVLERTLEAIHSEMGVEFIGFAIPDCDRESLRLHPSQIGFPTGAEKVALELEQSVCGRVFLIGEPMVIHDVRETSCYYEGVPETLSELAVPVGVSGEVAGVLNVESSELNAFNEQDVSFYTTIASQLSVALENARLFQAERRQRQQTEALEEAAAVVSGTLDLDRVLDRILEQVEKVVTGDAFNVALIEKDDNARVVRRRGYESEGWGVQSLSINDYPILLEMIKTGRPIAVPNTATEPQWIQEKGQELWRSYVGAPVKVGGVVVGFLNVNSTRPGTFSHQDAEHLQAFANHAATAIENAQLYEELHRYADDLEERVEERTSQLRAQYAQLEAILDSTTDGIILASSDGELVLANPVARNWLQHALSPEESDQLREAVKALAARAEGKPELVLELTGLDLQLTAGPVHKPTAGGMEDARAVVAIHDVSHLKALNRMKSRFVSNVSHELRTPIATIKLLAHLMHQQPERWEEYLEPLTREAEHQANLVRDILEMSRVDAGRLEIRPEPTSLNDLVGIALEKYESQARDRELTLTCDLGSPDPIAMADSQWIMQVLDNLLSNALRYTPEGGTIRVTTDIEVADTRSWATITVADTGIGIPEEELPYIFDRFFRGDRPRTMQISGTGLGLAILKEIVELHGGRVTVESEEDKGSSFTVCLPRTPQ
jgi:signal transduction histidine kinase/putative methionine-R-sulfoxide reductase with GAF domain